MKYICKDCGWIYNESRGSDELDIAPGTKFEDIPDDFECPFCFGDKSKFTKYEE